MNGPAAVVISGDAGRWTGGGAVRGPGAADPAAAGVAMRSIRTGWTRCWAGWARWRRGWSTRLPRVPWAGALTGELVSECEPGYWVRQAREPVRFADAVAALAAQGVTVFLEIGPDGTLSALGPAALPGAGDGAFIPVLRPGQPGRAAVLAALARAHVRGVAVDWAAVLGRRRAGGPADVCVPAAAVLAGCPGRRRRRRDRSATGGWRYRVTWVPVPDPEPAVLAGTWLVVVPAGAGAAGTWPRRARRRWRPGGAEVVVAEAAAGEPDRAVLAGPDHRGAGRTRRRGRLGSPGSLGWCRCWRWRRRRCPGSRWCRRGWRGRWRWCRRWATPGSRRRCGC